MSPARGTSRSCRCESSYGSKPLRKSRAYMAMGILSVALAYGASAAPVRFAIDQDYTPESQTVRDVTKDFGLMRALHIGILRTGIGWDDTNPKRHTFRWDFWQGVNRRAIQHGIELRPYYAYTPAWAGAAYNAPPDSAGDLARACGVMASTMGPYISSFEVWNEPDNPAFWTGSAREFGNDYADCAQAIHQKDARARVVLGGLLYLDSTWFSRMGNNAARDTDIAAYHEYTETPWDPTTVERDNSDAWFDEGYDGLSDSGRRAVWMNEGGASTARKQGYSEQSQASWIRRTVASVLGHVGRPVSLIGIYQLRDPAPGARLIGDHDAKIFFRHTGLFRADGTPKLAAHAVADLVSLLDGHDLKVETRTHYRRESGRVSNLFRIHAWRLEDGRQVACLWDRKSSSAGTLTFEHPAAAAFLHKPNGEIVSVPVENGATIHIREVAAGAIPLLYEAR